MKQLSRLLSVLLLLGAGGCLVLFGSGAQEGGREAAAAKSAAAPLIAALRARLDQGTCPETLAALVPASLPEVPQWDRRGEQRPFDYRCVAAEKRFLLAFPDTGGRFLPSDLFHEYDSRTQGWRLLDYSEVEAYRERPAAQPPLDGG